MWTGVFSARVWKESFGDRLAQFLKKPERKALRIVGAEDEEEDDGVVAVAVAPTIPVNCRTTSRPVQRLPVEIVRCAPGPAVVGILPAAVHGQQGEVVAGGMVELPPGTIGLGAVVTWPQKHIGHGDHGDDDDDVAGAAEAERLEEGSGEQRVHGEAGHGLARWSYAAPRGTAPKMYNSCRAASKACRGGGSMKGK